MVCFCEDRFENVDSVDGHRQKIHIDVVGSFRSVA